MVAAGTVVIPSHRLDIGVVQRCRRLETIEYDADGAAIAA
jgi:hypothetical protein